MPKTSSAPNRRILGEKGVAKELLGDFEPEGSRGMIFVMNFFNGQITVNRLVWLGTIFSRMLNIEFPRNFKRNRDLLIKWFDTNIELIEPLSINVSIVFEEEEIDSS